MYGVTISPCGEDQVVELGHGLLQALEGSIILLAVLRAPLPIILWGFSPFAETRLFWAYWQTGRTDRP